AFGEFNPGEQHVEIPVSLGKGTHTYRFVKKEDRSELYVDGTLTAIYHVPAFILDYVELDGHGFYGPYEGYWDYAAYTRGAYTPAELPSPGASTTTCVEVAGVPNWKQFDDGTNDWWDDIYDHSTRKISALGCLLTAAAQVVKKHGYDTDPSKLNKTLNNTAGGFDGRAVDLKVLATTVTAQGISLEYEKITGTDAEKKAALEDGLNNGNPVILQLYSVSKVLCPHFVVATKKCGNTIYINDPGHNNIHVTTLDQYFDLITNGNPKIIRSVRRIAKD
ncbi:MAG: C39 family peptidase, partial [Elusimicrobia bacterium]|nr:C39 family peptidase [Elusimicrobiota bacterium]